MGTASRRQRVEATAPHTHTSNYFILFFPEETRKWFKPILSRLSYPPTQPPFPTLLSRSVTPPNHIPLLGFFCPIGLRTVSFWPTLSWLITLDRFILSLPTLPPSIIPITLPDPASFYPLTSHVANAFASFRSLNFNSVTSPHPRVPSAEISVFPIMQPNGAYAHPRPPRTRSSVVTPILLLSLSPVRPSRGVYLIPCLRCYPVSFCHSQARRRPLPAAKKRRNDVAITTLGIFLLRPDQSQNTSDPKHTDHRRVTSTYHFE
jgi:hypothetical protein